MKLLSFVLFFSVSASALHAALGQSTEAAEWPTGSFDQQRDGWQRNETKLTVDTAKNIRLLWKLKTNNQPMGMQSFREPVIVAGVHTAGGIKTLAIFGGSSNAVFAIDVDSGSLVWQKDLKWSSDKPLEPGQGAGFICNNALTATPVVTPAGAAQRFLYVLTSDGYLHTMDLATGEEKELAIQMIPAIYGKAYGLNLLNNVVYTVTGQRCHGVLNELYAVDLTTKKAFSSTPGQGGIFGTAGPAIGSDGTIYFETGDGVYNVAAGELSTTVQAYTSADDHLTLKDYYTPSNHAWLTKRDLDMNTTPVVFPYKGRDLLVGSGKEGRYFLMDSKSLGGPDHETPLYRSPLVSNKNVNFQTEGTWGSFASWEGKDGTRWVLAPIGGPVAVDFPLSYGPTPNGGVIAFKVTDTGGKTQLTPAWVSRDMMTAEPPVVANGVVFALAAGEFTAQANDEDGGLYTFEDRIKHSIPAKLYALDAVTGKELYSSGDQIGSFLHQAGIAV
ncbi:MAG TPA: PQQ-binding-like beta-propeller repeat protein, partial [Acidobacteriaceae bacterium]|nr:PQQ-binding-like beta-propeller repeat protein [Acidobacteriaceae bacterium]